MAGKKERAIVLLSGGLDSTTVLYGAVKDGLEVHALSFEYGQKHAQRELRCAQKTAWKFKLAHSVISFVHPGGSLLLRGHDAGVSLDGIPATYVPARNIIFLAHALALAERDGARFVFSGMNAVDYSGYPDCRPEFLSAFQKVATVGTRRGVSGGDITIRAPLIALTKAEILRRAIALKVDLKSTSSCYFPSAHGACRECDACRIRLAAFKEVGKRDPVNYR